MGDMEMEVLKNVTIRMVTGNRALVQEQHRLRDANRAMRLEVLGESGEGAVRVTQQEREEGEIDEDEEEEPMDDGHWMGRRRGV